MKLSLIGIQGSGKGTLGDALQKNGFGKHVSTGDLIRNQIKKQTTIGKLAEQLITEGNFLDDENMKKVLEAELSSLDGYILDGYPRNIDQAKYSIDLGLEKVLYLKADESVIMTRIENRRYCPECNTNYNLLFKPPQVDGYCDVDGIELLQRKDDNPNAILKRIETFKSTTLPIIDFFKTKNMVIELDANLTPYQVLTQAIVKLGGRNDESYNIRSTSFRERDPSPQIS